MRLDDLIAASGAAIAPNMGRFTVRGARLALVALNLRLGLWVRNPLASSDHSRTRSRIRNGWREPGPLGAFQEAIGNLSLRADFLFISDGGHWENTGVVELLRRRCATVFAVDAATDQMRNANLIRMLSIARSELGVEFETTGAMLEGTEPVTIIRYRFPEDKSTEWPRRLVLMRTFVTPDMPMDLVHRASSPTGFPCHSTANQFLSASDVNAYVSFGRWLADTGLNKADLPDPVPFVEQTSDAGTDGVGGST